MRLNTEALAAVTPPLLLALMALALWLAPAPYLHDFGEWLFQAKVLSQQWTEPETVAGFQWAHYPVPNSLAVMILAMLNLLLPPFLAGKLFLLGLLLGHWWMALRFAKRIQHAGQQKLVAALILCLVGFSYLFWTGFISNQLSLLVFIAFLTDLGSRDTRVRWLAYAALLFFSHAMLFLAFMVLGAWHALLIAEQRRKTLPALALGVALGIWYLLGRQLSGFVAPVADANLAGWMEIAVYKLGFAAYLGPFKNLLDANLHSQYSGLSWVYWLGFLANGISAALIGWFCLTAVWRRPSDRHSLEFVIWLSALSYLAFVLVAPYNFFGLINPGGRLLLPLLLLCLLLVGKQSQGHPTNTLRWAAPWVLGFSLLTVASYAWLMAQASEPEQLTSAPNAGEAPRGSAFAYNDWLYSTTGFKYFNVRIFSFGGRYSQLAVQDYGGLGFTTGLILGFQPQPEASQ